MALTNAQKISLYQILGIPYAETYTVHDGMGTAPDYGTIQSTYSTIKTQLDLFLASLADGVETAIVGLITAWDSITTTAISMTSGAVGSINGITIDYEAQRALIRERMENLVPYIAQWRIAIRQSTTGPKPTSVVLMR